MRRPSCLLFIRQEECCFRLADRCRASCTSSGLGQPRGSRFRCSCMMPGSGSPESPPPPGSRSRRGPRRTRAARVGAGGPFPSVLSNSRQRGITSGFAPCRPRPSSASARPCGAAGTPPASCPRSAWSAVRRARRSGACSPGTSRAGQPDPVHNGVSDHSQDSGTSAAAAPGWTEYAPRRTPQRRKRSRSRRERSASCHTSHSICWPRLGRRGSFSTREI